MDASAHNNASMSSSSNMRSQSLTGPSEHTDHGSPNSEGNEPKSLASAAAGLARERQSLVSGTHSGPQPQLQRLPPAPLAPAPPSQRRPTVSPTSGTTKEDAKFGKLQAWVDRRTIVTSSVSIEGKQSQIVTVEDMNTLKNQGLSITPVDPPQQQQLRRLSEAKSSTECELFELREPRILLELPTSVLQNGVAHYELRISGVVDCFAEKRAIFHDALDPAELAVAESKFTVTTFKRFSDFYALDERLRRALGLTADLPPFPPKRVFGNTQPKFLEQRREKLQQYLQGIDVMFLILHSEEFRNFLRIPPFFYTLCERFFLYPDLSFMCSSSVSQVQKVKASNSLKPVVYGSGGGFRTERLPVTSSQAQAQPQFHTLDPSALAKAQVRQPSNDVNRPQLSGAATFEALEVHILKSIPVKLYLRPAALELIIQPRATAAQVSTWTIISARKIALVKEGTTRLRAAITFDPLLAPSAKIQSRSSISVSETGNLQQLVLQFQSASEAIRFRRLLLVTVARAHLLMPHRGSQEEGRSSEHLLEQSTNAARKSQFSISGADSSSTMSLNRGTMLRRDRPSHDDKTAAARLRNQTVPLNVELRSPVYDSSADKAAPSETETIPQLSDEPGSRPPETEPLMIISDSMEHVDAMLARALSRPSLRSLGRILSRAPLPSVLCDFMPKLEAFDGISTLSGSLWAQLCTGPAFQLLRAATSPFSPGISQPPQINKAALLATEEQAPYIVSPYITAVYINTNSSNPIPSDGRASSIVPNPSLLKSLESGKENDPTKLDNLLSAYRASGILRPTLARLTETFSKSVGGASDAKLPEEGGELYNIMDANEEWLLQMEESDTDDALRVLALLEAHTFQTYSFASGGVISAKNVVDHPAPRIDNELPSLAHLPIEIDKMSLEKYPKSNPGVREEYEKALRETIDVFDTSHFLYVTNSKENARIPLTDLLADASVSPSFDVYVSTWNLGNAAMPADVFDCVEPDPNGPNAHIVDSLVHDWLPSRSIAMERVPLIVIGVQESPVTSEAFLNSVLGHLGPCFECIARKTLWSIKIYAFARIDLVGKPLPPEYAAKSRLDGVRSSSSANTRVCDGDTPVITNIQTASVATGIMGILGNKGAVAIRMNILDTPILFVNSHLAPHTENVATRHRMYRAIIKAFSTALDESSALSVSGGHSPSVPSTADESADVSSQMETASNSIPVPGSTESATSAAVLMPALRFDCVFWLGDLNYRFAPSVTHERARALAYTGRYETLLETDQLREAIRKQQVFVDFQEGPIEFPPTYRLLTNSERKKAIKKGDKYLEIPTEEEISTMDAELTVMLSKSHIRSTNRASKLERTGADTETSTVSKKNDDSDDSDDDIDVEIPEDEMDEDTLRALEEEIGKPYAAAVPAAVAVISPSNERTLSLEVSQEGSISAPKPRVSVAKITKTEPSDSMKLEVTSPSRPSDVTVTLIDDDFEIETIDHDVFDSADEESDEPISKGAPAPTDESEAGSPASLRQSTPETQTSTITTSPLATTRTTTSAPLATSPSTGTEAGAGTSISSTTSVGASTMLSVQPLSSPPTQKKQAPLVNPPASSNSTKWLAPSPAALASAQLYGNLHALPPVHRAFSLKRVPAYCDRILWHIRPKVNPPPVYSADLCAMLERRRLLAVERLKLIEGKIRRALERTNRRASTQPVNSVENSPYYKDCLEALLEFLSNPAVVQAIQLPRIPGAVASTLAVQLVDYSACRTIESSDHNPVRALFKLRVPPRPPLSAYERKTTVYLTELTLLINSLYGLLPLGSAALNVVVSFFGDALLESSRGRRTLDSVLIPLGAVASSGAEGSENEFRITEDKCGLPYQATWTPSKLPILELGVGDPRWIIHERIFFVVTLKYRAPIAENNDTKKDEKASNDNATQFAALGPPTSINLASGAIAFDAVATANWFSHAASAIVPSPELLQTMGIQVAGNQHFSENMCSFSEGENCKYTWPFATSAIRDTGVAMAMLQGRVEFKFGDEAW